MYSRRLSIYKLNKIFTEFSRDGQNCFQTYSTINKIDDSPIFSKLKYKYSNRKLSEFYSATTPFIIHFPPRSFYVRADGRRRENFQKIPKTMTGRVVIAAFRSSPGHGRLQRQY